MTCTTTKTKLVSSQALLPHLAREWGMLEQLLVEGKVRQQKNLLHLKPLEFISLEILL